MEDPSLNMSDSALDPAISADVQQSGLEEEMSNAIAAILQEGEKFMEENAGNYSKFLLIVVICNLLWNCFFEGAFLFYLGPGTHVILMFHFGV